MISKTLVTQILTILSEQAPKRVSVEKFGLCDDATLAKHLTYMAQERLIDNDADEVVGYDTTGDISHFESCTITSRGTSYIGKDDNIRQELNTIHVTFNTDELRQLLLDNITQNAEPDQKEKMTQFVKSLSKEVLTEICKELIVKGLTGGALLAYLSVLFNG